MKTKNKTSKSIKYEFTDEDVGTVALTFPNTESITKEMSKTKNGDMKAT